MSREGGTIDVGRTTHALARDGAICDWLVSPVWSRPCDDLAEFVEASGSPWGPDGRWVLTNGPDAAPLKERIFARHPLDTDQELPAIVEGGELSFVGPFSSERDTGTWQRWHAAEDGLLDWSAFCFIPRYRYALGACLLEVDQSEWRTFEIASTGPIAVWLGSQLVAAFTEVSYMELHHEVRFRLPTGATPLLLASWQVAFRDVRQVARIAVCGPAVKVVIPSPSAEEEASIAAEQVLNELSLDSWAVPEPTVGVSGPKGAALTVVSGNAPAVRLVLKDGRAMVDLPPHSGDPTGFELAAVLTTGETTLSIGVDDPGCPVRRELRCAILPPDHRSVPEGSDPEVWRREFLEHVLKTPPSVARALARLHLDHDAQVQYDDIETALTMLNDRADCADFQAVALLRLFHDASNGSWREGTKDCVCDALIGFKYWIDQPGLDAMCYFTENHQLVFHTAELLAGESFSSEIFKNTGWSGIQHAEHARSLALEWMRRKLAGGFSEFDSNSYLAIDALALVSLVDYAKDPDVVGLAEAVLDKLLLSLATNSWRGCHSSAHGRSYTPMLRSSRFDETAPIMWVLFGTGTLNLAVLPPAALATSRRYRLPRLIRSVATDYESPWAGRQVYRGTYRLHSDLRSHPYRSDVRVFRTNDAMLSSVQDYRVGLPGIQEHIFGATLSPEVQVFCTWPASRSDSSSARPNAWAGERILPRVRQHRDSLLVVYPSSSEAPCAPTHVWFPAPWMDETATKGAWLAGRVGNGYVAIACADGLRSIETGQTARQEWWPNGDGQGYVVTIGDATSDGSFRGFVAALGAPKFNSPGHEPFVRWTTRDGTELALSLTGTFAIDGRVPDLSDDGTPERPPHLDNPALTVEFGASRLEAQHRGERLVLDLENGRRVEPRSALDVGEHDGT